MDSLKSRRCLEGRKYLYEALSTALEKNETSLIFEHLPQINEPILDYCAPDRHSNNTSIERDEISEYLEFLEKKNMDLIAKIEELERKYTDTYLELDDIKRKFKTIEPYIPTITRIIDDYATAEERMERKKRSLIEKYGITPIADFELWAGADRDVDIAKRPLDEILNDEPQ